MNEASCQDERRSVFGQALRRLRSAGVDVCLLRDEPDISHVGNELDVLIMPRDWERAYAELRSLGWELIDTGRFIPLKRALLLWRSGELLKFDVHLDMVDGSLVYMDRERVMNTSREGAGGWLVPSDESWFAHIVMHAVLGKGVLDRKYHDRLRRVLKGGMDERRLIRDAAVFGLDEIYQAVLSEPMAALTDRERVGRFRREAIRRLLRRSPANAWRSLRWKLVWSVGQLLGLRRGVLIAVVGPDGAGKSTFLSELKRALKALEIPSRTMYMGPWEYPILPTSRFVRYLGATPRDDTNRVGADASAAHRVSKRAKALVKRYLYYSCVFIEMWARHLLRVWPHLQLRRVVIADRYIYDLEVGYYNAIVRNSPRLRRRISDSLPKPDITILLDNDAEVIWERKKEYPLETIARSLEAYHDLASRRNFEIIRTDEPVEVIVSSFLERSWRHITRLRRDG